MNGEVRRALRGLDAEDQGSVDAVLVERDGPRDRSRLGSNSLIATSMAVAHASAVARGQPLWQALAAGREVCLPLPEVDIFGGRAHAARQCDIQEFMIIPAGAHDYAEALEQCAEVYRAAGLILDERGGRRGIADTGGYWPTYSSNEEALELIVGAIERAGLVPGDDIGISIDVAASQLYSAGRYHFSLEARSLDSAEMVAMLVRWTQKFPIVALEDPVAEDDERGMVEITRVLGPRVEIIGDDFLATDAQRVQHAAAIGACNAAIIKPSQIGTLTCARSALDAASAHGWNTILSARSGDTEDVTIMHLAVGWGAPQIKVGGFARSDRMAKWNEGLRIAESVGGGGRLPERRRFPWGGGNS